MEDYLGTYKNRPRTVVFYGRVSTEHEQQISALGNQMEWYLEGRGRAGERKTRRPCSRTGLQSLAQKL